MKYVRRASKPIQCARDRHRQRQDYIVEMERKETKRYARVYTSIIQRELIMFKS